MSSTPDTATSLAPLPQGHLADGDIPLIDWQGGPIDCSTCAHADLRASGGCEPGRSCMQDAYARRIDRFFRSHRELAAQHLEHPYFEVRAIAARHTDVFRLPPLLDDPDETVRLQVALRVPQRLLQRLCDDPHREVRIRVAQRIDTEHLSRMVRDPDYEVRATVARRLPVALLPLLAADPDEQVRCQVARRLEMPALWRLVHDASPLVRRLVAERLPAALLDALAGDDDFMVRWQAAGRALGATLQRLLDDDDSEVRARARERLAELDGSPETAEPAAAQAAAPITASTQGAEHG